MRTRTRTSRARGDALSRSKSLRVVAMVPLAAVVCSQCEAVGGLRRPLDSIRRVGAMGRGRWRLMRRWKSGANCRQPRSRGFVRGARAPSVTPGFSRGTRSAVVGKPHAVAVEQVRRVSRAIRCRVVLFLLSFRQARQGKGRVHNGAYFYTSNENRTRCAQRAAFGNLSSTHRAHFFAGLEHE